MFLFFIQNLNPTTPIEQEFYRLLFFCILFALIIFFIGIIVHLRDINTQIFMINILEMCMEYNEREHIQYDNQSTNALDWFYSKLPPKEEILYSFKPLKLSSFIDQNLIDKLQS